MSKNIPFSSIRKAIYVEPLIKDVQVNYFFSKRTMRHYFEIDFEFYGGFSEKFCFDLIAQTDLGRIFDIHYHVIEKLELKNEFNYKFQKVILDKMKDSVEAHKVKT